jgi:hypothetical protein
MEPNDRDRMLLAFANLASHGIAARPAMASDAAGLAAELGARHPRGLGSYVFWHRDDDASFDPTGTLTDALTLALQRRGVAHGRARRAARSASMSFAPDGVIVASGRLARGNPSVAIGVDLTALLNVVRRWQTAVAGRPGAAGSGLRRRADQPREPRRGAAGAHKRAIALTANAIERAKPERRLRAVR